MDVMARLKEIGETYKLSNGSALTYPACCKVCRADRSVDRDWGRSRRSGKRTVSGEMICGASGDGNFA